MATSRDGILNHRQRFIDGLDISWIDPPAVYRPEANTAPVIPLDELRHRIRDNRAAVLGQPGCFLDTSPTGSGKSTADQHCIQRLLDTAENPESPQALIVVPTHQECREQVAALWDVNIQAIAYPARRTEPERVICPRCRGAAGHIYCFNCQGAGHQELRTNCWNTEQPERAEQMGLSLVQSVCRNCPHNRRCNREGYLREIQQATVAPVAVATHARAQHTGLVELSRRRKYLSVHEDCMNLIRPVEHISPQELECVRAFADELTNDPDWLNYFGSGGNEFNREHRQACYQFMLNLFRVVERLRVELNTAEASRLIHLEEIHPRPDHLEGFLFWAAERTRFDFRDAPWRLLLAAAAGEIERLAVVVSSSKGKGGKNILHRQITGVWINRPPAAATTVFSDATTERETLEALLNCPVQDITPPGRLELQHDALQFTQDVKRTTAGKTVQNLLRGLLIAHPDRNRVGVICHQPHVENIESLESEYRKRIEKIAYFGSGEERGSNEWYRRCDYLIIIGTPRLPGRAIQARLLQLGRCDAIGRDPEWNDRLWEGTTASGIPTRIKSRGYQDADWHHAHRSLVRATIVQAIGRGRGFLPDGIPVAVITSEECGLRLHDHGKVRQFSESCQQVYTALRELAAENSKENPLEFSAANSGIPTARICERTGLNARNVRDSLDRLTRFCLARKVGERSGWLSVCRIDSASAPPPTNTD